METDDFAESLELEGIDFDDGDVVGLVFAQDYSSLASIKWHVDHENRRNYFTATIIGYKNDEKFKTKDEAVRISQLVMQLLP